MSFAGFVQVSQVCPKSNLQHFEVSSTRLRSHTKAYSLMGFAGLQVCFRSERAEILENSIERNKMAIYRENCGKLVEKSTEKHEERMCMHKRKCPQIDA